MIFKQKLVSQMWVAQMSVGQMSVGQILVGHLSVVEMFFYQKVRSQYSVCVVVDFAGIPLIVCQR
jgi:hypothetical protein